MLVVKGDYKLACIGCRTQSRLSLYPHRLGDDVVGILVICPKCEGRFAEKVIVWNVEGEGNAN
jgi:hypothetical protein